MAQKYYEFVNYKEENVRDQRRVPRGASHRYIIIFQSIFYSIFHMSFVLSQLPVHFFLSKFFYSYNHTLFNVRDCGAAIQHGILPNFNLTVLHTLPPSLNLIYVESALMGAALVSMLLILLLCGSAYRPTEEIDLRSIGWGNIFQLPFKHARDYRLRCLAPYFFYSGFEVLFACTGFALCYGVCSLGLESLPFLLTAYGISASISSFLALCMLRFPRQIPLVGGALLHCCILIGLFFWSPTPRLQSQKPLLYLVAVLWGIGSGLNKSSLSIIIGMFYEDKERQDFVFTIYHWLQALAIFIVYLWSWIPVTAKLGIMLASALIAVLSYLWMEHKLSCRVPFRVPKIPAPRHKVKGYRYMEEENSDESGSEGEGEQSEGGESEEEAQAGPQCRQPGKRQCYEQAVGDDE